MRTNWFATGAALFLSSVPVAEVAAHHTAAMFDRTKSVAIPGTVRVFQWTNPHCFIQLLVPTEGKVIEWSVEMGSPTELYRSGWRPGTLHPGQEVIITIHPTKDGSPSGLFSSGTHAEGVRLGGKVASAKVP